MTIYVPRYISEQYADGAHGFRKEKRAALRGLKAELDELRLGCACFPNGGKRHVEAIAAAVPYFFNK